MEYRRLRSSGLKVSRISLGCLGYGDGSRETWARVHDGAARPNFRQANDLGIAFWDTANIYSLGASEKIVGRAIKEFASRDDLVLATKVHQHMRDGPGIVDAIRRIAETAECLAQVAMAWLLKNPGVDPPSWERPRNTTSPTRQPDPICSSATTKSPRSSGRTCGASPRF